MMFTPIRFFCSFAFILLGLVSLFHLPDPAYALEELSERQLGEFRLNQSLSISNNERLRILNDNPSIGENAISFTDKDGCSSSIPHENVTPEEGKDKACTNSWDGEGEAGQMILQDVMFDLQLIPTTGGIQSGSIQDGGVTSEQTGATSIGGLPGLEGSFSVDNIGLARPIAPVAPGGFGGAVVGGISAPPSSVEISVKD